MSETTALGWSLTANIDGNRQIVFQSFIALDATDEDVNAMLDRANRIVDRMRAVYEIPELKARRDKFLSEISQAEQDIAEAEHNHQKAVAGLQEQIKELQRLRGQEFEAAYERHRHDGRQGTFVPKGATKANLDRMDAGAEQYRKDIERAEAERQQSINGFNVALQRRRDEVDLLNRQIEEAEAKIA